MNMFQTKCASCNANLDINLDKPTAFCPYCGSKIILDADLVSKALSEREETKRTEIREKEEKITQFAKFCWLLFL